MANKVVRALLGADPERLRAQSRARKQRRTARKVGRLSAGDFNHANGHPAWPPAAGPQGGAPYGPPPQARPGMGPAQGSHPWGAASPADTGNTGPIPVPPAAGGWSPSPQTSQPPAGPAPQPVQPTAPASGNDEGASSSVWSLEDALPVESSAQRWWRRTRMVALVVVVAVGVLSIARTVVDGVASLADEPATGPAAPAVSDARLRGFASVVALEYLSWSGETKARRQQALARYAAAGVDIDGWSGSGRLLADSAVPMGITRASGSAAVVTLRVRVTPFAATDEQAKAGDAPAAPKTDSKVPNVASAPNPAAAGWKPLSPRWLSLAVPVARRGGHLVVTATPALVGSPPTAVPAEAVTSTSSADSAGTQATRRAVTTLMRNYASGELGYSRASGARFVGLNGAVSLVEIVDWQMAPVPAGKTARRRMGDVTVTWELASGAGQLTTTYRIALVRQQDKWLLASVAVALTGGKQQ